jgi:hypothetical protein
MRTPDYYQRRAREARNQAIAMDVFAAACLLALLLIGGNLAGTSLGWIPLALLTGAVVSATGSAIEWAEARLYGRLARMEDTFQPRERL